MSTRALDRALKNLRALHPQEIDLNLDRILRLLDKLGNPHLRLPPVFHVAGTNGKGSTIAFLRACLEASGKRVHVYTSPHLVRFHERIRLNGHLIDDDLLISILRDVHTMNGSDEITLFEAITSAAFLAFARVPADVVLLEVGLGGRLDATNVVPNPVSTGICQIALDHQAFLGTTLIQIALEKAGIAKRGTPLVHQKYDQWVSQKVAEVATFAGAPVVSRGAEWDCTVYDGHMHYRDYHGKLILPLPRMMGPHQVDNAGLAIAMLRHQNTLSVPDSALRAGLGWAEWPARLQRLYDGKLVDALPNPDLKLWLDGGHNPAAAKALARACEEAEIKPIVIVAMLSTKDAVGFLKPFSKIATRVVAVPQSDTAHTWHAPHALCVAAESVGLPSTIAASLPEALAQAETDVLICGSLYFAGQVLAENGTEIQ